MDSQQWPFEAAFGPASNVHQTYNFGFIGQDLIIEEGGQFPQQGAQALARFGPASEALHFGSIGGVACAMHLWPAGLDGLDGLDLPAGMEKADYRRLWGRWTQAQLDALSRARQLAVWLGQHRFCGVCGGPMHTRSDSPARECAACGHLDYPRIAPVCIGLVLKGDEILLARSPHFPPGIYSALAGYLEAGESVEQCLRREIREEAGIEIGAIRWFGSQSWPYPNSLMMGFFADYAGGELRPQPEEIEDLRWFRRDALPALPHPSTIAYQMIAELTGLFQPDR